ncbi:MAG: LysM peptidoglycan-binding domain-containing protein [Anaerolineales bacterium]|nr:LysM peptidoglycan-binding domain-containing protein [Anaerolineales bacterium]
MKKSHMLFFIVIISSLLFSACTMSASTPPPITPTTNLSEIARQATETAIAKTPKAGETLVPDETQETVADITPTVAAPTSTPDPVVTEEPSVPDPVSYAVPDSYTIHKGEFVFCLARRFNILPADIMTYNGYESGDILYPGEIVQIPPNSRAYIGERALQYHPTTYTVIPGDTLYSISCLFGNVDPRTIASANDLDIDQALSSGTILQIP